MDSKQKSHIIWMIIQNNQSNFSLLIVIIIYKFQKTISQMMKIAAAKKNRRNLVENIFIVVAIKNIIL